MADQKKAPVPGALAGNGTEAKGQGSINHLGTRLERYGRAHAWTRDMVAHLDDVMQLAPHGPERMEAESVLPRLRDCGHYLRFRHYYTVDQVRLSAANFCMKHHLCPLCAIRRAAKNVEAYVKKLEVIRQEQPQLVPLLLTLTVRNGPNLQERKDHLKASFKRLQDRRRDWIKKGRGWTELARAEGAVWSYEVTNKGNGWHPHLHAIVLVREGDFVDLKALKAEWEAITGDSHQVDVRKVGDDPVSGFAEVFKYALKFSELSHHQAWKAYLTLRGQRLVGSFGCLRGVEVPEDLTDELLDDLPYIELLYNYLPGVGYQRQPLAGEATPA